MSTVADLTDGNFLDGPVEGGQIRQRTSTGPLRCISDRSCRLLGCARISHVSGPDSMLYISCHVRLDFHMPRASNWPPHSLAVRVLSAEYAWSPGPCQLALLWHCHVLFSLVLFPTDVSFIFIQAQTPALVMAVHCFGAT